MPLNETGGYHSQLQQEIALRLQLGMSQSGNRSSFVVSQSSRQIAGQQVFILGKGLLFSRQFQFTLCYKPSNRANMLIVASAYQRTTGSRANVRNKV